MNEKDDLSPQEMVERIKEYARLNRMIIDLKEVAAVEWKVCDDVFEHALNHSVRFHMKNGKSFQRRMSWKHIQKVMGRFKAINSNLIDTYDEEE